MQAITFTNTGVPLLVLGAASLVLPYVFIPKDTRSHSVLIRGLAMSAISLLALSTLLLLIFDPRDASAGAASVGGLALAVYYVMNALKFALLWVPLLALVWFGCAQRVERLRGEDMAREDRA